MSFRNLEQAKTPHTGNDWLQVLEEYAVQAVVLNQIQDKKLVEILQRRAEWIIEFEGEGTTIFTRPAQREGS